jgi:D-alanyl-D-alanine carboxypeptidase
MIVLPASSPAPLPVSLAPVALPDHPVPEITAKNVFIIDRTSRTVLMAKNADDRIYPASTTKMMTAIVSYEKYPLNKLIEVGQAYPEGTTINLRPGEQVTVDNLLNAMLVQSNDRQFWQLIRQAGLLNEMNFKAGTMHLFNTIF